MNHYLNDNCVCFLKCAINLVSGETFEERPTFLIYFFFRMAAAWRGLGKLSFFLVMQCQVSDKRVITLLE